MKSFYPSASEVRKVALEEISAAGAIVKEDTAAGDSLFLRSVLRPVKTLAPGDGFQGGVAICAHASQIRVHPYTFRLVCRNGAIQARATRGSRLERSSYLPPAHVVSGQLDEVRGLVRECLARSAFHESMQEIGETVDQDASMLLGLLPEILNPRLSAAVRRTVLQHLVAVRPDSAYGLLNAITALARDVPDPLRWDLEELGGGIPALLRRPRRPGDGSATPSRHENLVTIG